MSSKRGKEQAATGQKPGFGRSSIPLYYQLATLLRQKILSREYKPDQRLPSEARLAADYSMSRMTVRQALASLQEEKLIRREPGRGTFVTGPQEKSSGDRELDRSVSDLISMGLSTSLRLVELKERPANPDEAADLRVAPGDPILRCRRLRFYHDRPYCYIINSFPQEIGRQLSEEQLCKGSVLRFIETDLGIPLRIARQRLRATLADAHLAGWLNVRIGDPLLHIDYHICTDGDRPVEVAELFYRSDIYSFTLHMTRSEGSDQNGTWTLKEDRFEH